MHVGWMVREIYVPEGGDWNFDKTQLAEGVSWKIQPRGEEEEEETLNSRWLHCFYK